MSSIDHYAEGRTRISRIQKRLDEQIEILRVNSSLSPQGRRAEMAKYTVQARQAADKVRNEHVAARKTKRDQLERHLFGAESSGDVALMRDAQDRAKAIETPESAATALRQAQLSGDRTIGQGPSPATPPTHGWDGRRRQLRRRARHHRTGLRRSLLVAKVGRRLPDGPHTATADAAAFRVRPPRELGDLP